MNHPPVITFVSFGIFEKGLLEKISGIVVPEFGYPVKVTEVHADLTKFYNPDRRQYNGDQLLKEVDALNYQGSVKTIGLFNVDLYIPILTYIFGQAQLGGRTAIASLFRLNNELYGIKTDDELNSDRFAKEIIHELGHTFGLIHCHTPSCVMRSSTYVEDIDQKKPHFCPGCRSLLEKA